MKKWKPISASPGGKIIQRKGATFYAVAASVVPYLQVHLLPPPTPRLTVSTMMHGEYGIDDVCLSTLTVVGRDGYQGQAGSRSLNEQEQAKLLRKSADTL